MKAIRMWVLGLRSMKLGMNSYGFDLCDLEGQICVSCG